jgi:FAD-dependent oxidoreductase domain-containing protein 1
MPFQPPKQVVIIGGGVMGAATAWCLARLYGVAVTVLERDATYTRASSALSVCAIRQQFSTSINARLSRLSLLFYRRIGEFLAVGDEAPSIGLVEPGYLYLAATSAGALQLRQQQVLLDSCQVHTELFESAALHARFPWMQTDDLMLGSLGLSTPTSGEGWFDGYAVLQAFRKAGVAIGVQYLEAEAESFETSVQPNGTVVHAVRTLGGDDVVGDAFVLTAGAWTAPLAAQLGVSLPVRARKRDVFAFECDVDLRDAPLVIDPSGVWFRPEVARGRFLCGSPPRGPDLDDVPLEQVDHGLFDEVIWPVLAARVPAFDALRVTSSWAGYYEMNTFDQNGLVGPLPGVANAFTACGFSGHGLQQAPAVGLGLADRIMRGWYEQPSLQPLAVERVALNRPLYEKNVI